MTINIALLDKALAHIDANPEEWNQATWICGSAACVAGHVILQGAGTPGDFSRLEYLDSVPGDRVGHVASLLLGLPADGGHPLWDAEHTRTSLQIWRDSLAGVRVVAPFAMVSHADLRGINLRDADLRGADLRGVDFGGADLRGADLRGAATGFAYFDNAQTDGIKLGPL